MYSGKHQQRHDFASILLQVQRRMFQIFVAKKRSFESHPEEAFLRSLQQQIRNYRKTFLDPNIDLKNIKQAKHLESQQKEAVMYEACYHFVCVLDQALQFSPHCTSYRLLTFIENLVEGHQTDHQEFLLKQPQVWELKNKSKRCSPGIPGCRTKTSIP